MEIFIYAVVFIMGTFFGSFFTLAVYRIPLGKDILYEHSFCPNCNSKLNFVDLIPILSYISLRGKCRYCGEKVRIRYLILEILSGFVFLLFALSLKVNLYNIDLNKIIYFLFFIIYISVLFIIAGIDKEKIKIEKSVLLFGLILAVCFMIYVCISKTQVIYTYIICLTFIMLLLILDIVFLKKNLSENYGLSILILSLYMIVFTGIEAYYYTLCISLFLVAIYIIFKNIKKAKRRKNIINTDNTLKIPLGFYLSISNIFIIIVTNFLLIKV